MKNWMRTGAITILAGTAMALTPKAQSAPAPSQIVNCWDGSFAYTRATVETVNDQQELLKVDLESENQLDFKSVLPDKFQAWGLVRVSFYLRRSDCVFGAQPDIMSCESRGSDIRIAFDEDEESRKILSFFTTDLKFITTRSGKAFNVALSFVKHDTTVTRTLQLGFGLWSHSACQPFPPTPQQRLTKNVHLRWR